MRTLRRDILSVYFATAVNGVLGLALVPLGVSIMGKAGYGLFSLYSVVYSYITLLESGFTKNLVRLLASNKDLDARQRHLRTALGFYIVIAALLLIALPALVSIVPGQLFDIPPQSMRSAGWIIIFSTFEYIITIPTSMMTWYGTADEKFPAISKFNIISGFYRFGLMYIGLFVFRTPEVVVALSASRRLIDLFVIPRIVGRLPSGAWRPTFQLRELRAMFAHSVPLTVAQVGVTSLYAAPSVLVSRLFGLEALGAYRAIFDLGNRVWFFSTGIGAVVFPKLVRAFSRGVSQLQQQRLYAAFYYSWAAYLMMALAGVVFAPVIITFMHLSTSEYFAVWALVFVGICMSAHAELAYQLLQATSRYRPLLTWTLSATILMIGVTLLVSPSGLLAVGYGWLLSLGVYTACMDAAALAVIGAPRIRQIALLLAKVGYLIPVLGVIYVSAPSSTVPVGVVVGAMIFIGILQVYSLILYRRLRSHSTMPTVSAVSEGALAFDALPHQEGNVR